MQWRAPKTAEVEKCATLGNSAATDAATRKLVAKLVAKHSRLTFCYEAGPTGYGLYRLIMSLGHECKVVAPSLTPKKPGDQVKTNRRAAVSLARLSRAGELTALFLSLPILISRLSSGFFFFGSTFAFTPTPSFLPPRSKLSRDLPGFSLQWLGVQKPLRQLR